jgi:hypothetical protein
MTPFQIKAHLHRVSELLLLAFIPVRHAVQMQADARSQWPRESSRRRRDQYVAFVWRGLFVAPLTVCGERQ